MNFLIESSLPEQGLPCPELSQFNIGGGKVCQVVQYHQVPYSLAVLSYLGTASFLLQGLVDVRKPNGQVVPPSLYCVGIAESGERKSTIENEFTKTIYDYLSNQKKERDNAKVDYENRLRIWEAEKRILIKNISKLSAAIVIQEVDFCSDNLACSNAELARLKELLNLHELKKPRAARPTAIAMFSDTTPAALVQCVGEHGTRSAGVFTSEGGEFFLNGFKNTTSALNKAWSGEGFKRNRVGDHGDFIDCRLALNVQMQPAVAEEVFFTGRRKLSSTGFMARTLLAFPQSMVGTRRIGPLPTEDERDVSYQRRVEELLKLNSVKDDGSQIERTTLVFSLKASERWFVVANEIERLTAPGGRFYGFGDHAAKSADNVVRVAAVEHAFEYGLDGEISVETLNEAINLCCYFSDQYIQIFQEPSQEYIDTLKLDQWLCGKRNEGIHYILKRDVLTYGPLRKAAQLNFALGMLERQGIVSIKLIPGQTRMGRATKSIYVINLKPRELDNYVLLNQTLTGFREDGI